MKALRDSLGAKLQEKRKALTPEESRRLVLDIARDDLTAELGRYVAANRREVMAAVESWWDRYRVSVRKIEDERDKVAARLDSALDALGYTRQREAVYAR